MALSMPKKRYQKLMLGLLLCYLVYALLAFVLVATWGKARLISTLEDMTGQSVQVGSVWFNPFANALSVSAFELADGEGQILSFNRLSVNVDLLPLVVGKLHVRQVELHQPFVRVDLLPDGQVNLAQLFVMDETDETDGAQSEAVSDGVSIIPVIARFDLFRGQVAVIDKTLQTPARLDFGDIGVRVQQLALEAGKTASVWLEAVLPTQGRLIVNGGVSPLPLSLELQASVQQLDLSRLTPWVQKALALSVVSGLFNGHFDVALHDEGKALTVEGEASVDALALEEADSVKSPDKVSPLLAFEQFAVKGIAVDLAQQTVRIDEVALQQLASELELFADGSTTLDRLLVEPDVTEPDVKEPDVTELEAASQVSLTTSDMSDTDDADDTTQVVEEEKEPAPVDWQFALGKLTVHAKRLAVLHQGVQPAYRMAVDDLALVLDNLDNRGAQGTFELTANLLGQPLDEQASGLRASAQLAVHWLLALDHTELEMSGDAGLSDAVFADDQGKTVIAFDRFDAEALHLDTRSLNITLKQLALKGLQGSMVAFADGSNSLERLMPAVVAAPAARSARPATPVATEQAWSWRLDQLTVDLRKFDYVDRSLAPPFAVSLEPLALSLAPLASNDPKARLSVDARLDGFSPLSIKGTLAQLMTTPVTDLDVTLKNYDMKALSPYTGRYVSHLVDKGRLSINSNISLNNMKLTSRSEVVAEQFYLGDKVQSDEAVKAPVKFGLSVLRDRKGNILLPLSIDGDLNDPSVSVGGLIVKTIMNVLTKAATAPLSVLSMLAGGVDLEKVVFTPGSAELDETQSVVLQSLADVMQQQPGLALGLAGRASPEDAKVLLAQGVSEKALEKAMQTLADKRAHHVHERLIKEFDVPKERLAHEAAAVDATLSGVALNAIQL